MIILGVGTYEFTSDWFVGSTPPDPALQGDLSNEFILGLEGNDEILPSAGDDLIDGGGGIDTVNYANTTQGIIVNLNGAPGQEFLVLGPAITGPGPGGPGGGPGAPPRSFPGTATSIEIGNDLLTSIENVIGGAGADIITGDAADNMLDGGGGFDQLFGGVGNDTIVFDAADDLANVLGGEGDDTLLITTGELPIDFSLADHGFEQARFEHIGTNAGSSGVVTEIYNTDWQIIDRTAGYENGITETTLFDLTDARNYSEIRSRFDAENKLDIKIVYFDDGTRDLKNFDQDDSASWSEILYRFDADNNLDSSLVYFDGGARAVRNLDQDDTASWSTILNRFDADNNLVSSLVHFDDGARAVRNFDQEDAFGWSEALTRYDAEDNLDLRIIDYDDGDRLVRNYDQDDAFGWSRIDQHYDADNNLVLTQIYNDDGLLI